MATMVSAWGKPGAWALDSEKHEPMEMLQKEKEAAALSEPSADFPSLAAAAATKASNKKKGQTLSLAEFSNGGNPVTHGSAKFQVRSSSAVASKGLTPDELLVLPTGPRERTPEELERANSRGFRYSYGGGGGSRTNAEDSVSRWDSSRVSDEARRNSYGNGGAGSDRDLAPSRADEIDDWVANKQSAPPPTERRERTGGFFESHSRADESDRWISNKSAPPPLSASRRMGDGYRERRGGYEFSNRELSSGGGGPDFDTWGKKREDLSGERPRLKLQPRTLPLAKGDGDHRGEQQQGSKSKGPSPCGATRPREEVLAEQGLSAEEGQHLVSGAGEHHGEQQASKSKGPNPFGAARPREDVLAEKGQDWKRIDEQLESMKVREVASAVGDRLSFGKKGFGQGSGHGNIQEDRTDRNWNWRKADTVTSPAPSQRGGNGLVRTRVEHEEKLLDLKLM